MADFIKHLLSNGLVLFIPIFLWNLIFIKKLPPAFEDKTFDKNVPKFILIGETVFRAIIFLMPIIVEIEFGKITGNIGFHIYLTGVVIYFFTWLCLIYYPDTAWSKSLPGFCGPGYTPIIWLVGFAFTVKKFNIDVNYSVWFYLVPSVIFVFFHVVHSIIAYDNSKKVQRDLISAE